MRSRGRQTNDDVRVHQHQVAAGRIVGIVLCLGRDEADLSHHLFVVPIIAFLKLDCSVSVSQAEGSMVPYHSGIGFTGTCGEGQDLSAS